MPTDSYPKTVVFTWHHHNRPIITVGTPPHVHAHTDGDDVEHAHPGLGAVCMVGR